MAITWKTIGFESNKEFFKKALQNSWLAHAYLFTGQEMMGKRTFATELAFLVMGHNNELDRMHEPSNHPDIIIVNASSSESGQTITISEARRIKNFVSLKPYSGTKKVVIIDDAHLMTVEAQNALLKIIEEPGQSSVLILVTANPDSLLDTVRSRCQEIKFSPHSKKIILEVLNASGLTEARKDFLIDFANGRLGLIKIILKENSFDEVEKTIKELAHLSKAGINERLVAAQKIIEQENKENFARKILYWQLYMRLRLGNEPKAAKIISGLLAINKIVAQPQFNQRLALENFFIQL